MSFDLEFHQQNVVPFLMQMKLSREGRIVLARVLRDLQNYAHVYAVDPSRRLAPGSDCFQVDVLFRDRTNQMLHLLKFILSDAAAAYGVIRVVYVEDEHSPFV